MPKPGMVMPTIPFLSSPIRSYVPTATSSAKVLSKPPLIPITTFLQPVCFRRFAKPKVWMLKISSMRLSRASLVLGVKGWGEYVLVRSRCWLTIISVSMWRQLAEGVDFATSANELFFLRSFLMYSVSISVVISWASMAKGKSSARMFPFSHTMACPPNTRSVLLSPKPAPAYTYPAMHLALCVHTIFFMYSSFPAKAVSAARFRIISAPIRDRSVEGALGA